MDRKLLLIILDGFGEGKNYPFNAIVQARMPFYRELYQKFPRAQLQTCGEAVGLPPGIMGNSEVGHMNIGAGRVVFQELTKINREIRANGLATNPAIFRAVKAVQENPGTRLHLLGLISDGGVHSHIDHLLHLIDVLAPLVPLTIHLITDGRDTPPGSAEKFLYMLRDQTSLQESIVIGSLSGRYYAMDRDNRWDRVEKAYHAILHNPVPTKIDAGNGIDTALAALRTSYAAGVTDEFIIPVSIASKKGRGCIETGDSVLFFNFRADRAREITRALAVSDFDEFSRGGFRKPSQFVCLTEYDARFQLPVAFPPQNLTQILPEVLANQAKRQFRIAETEKYAHVTFFFNCGRESPFSGEERMLIPSPKEVATYDMKPEMSAFEVTQQLENQIRSNKHDFLLVNYANPDMVGHTGNFSAAVKALETVDACLKNIVSAALQGGYTALITADHGNIEEMVDEESRPHTQHTLNPVPIHCISTQAHLPLDSGVLADVAPTALEIMGLPIPAEMTGRSLFRRKKP